MCGGLSGSLNYIIESMTYFRRNYIIRGNIGGYCIVIILVDFLLMLLNNKNKLGINIG